MFIHNIVHLLEDSFYIAFNDIVYNSNNLKLEEAVSHANTWTGKTDKIWARPIGAPCKENWLC